MLYWDHVIFSLQNQGGISNWWRNHCNILRDSIACPITDLGPFAKANPQSKLLRLPNEISPHGSPGSLWFLRRVPTPKEVRFFHSSYFRLPGRGPRVLMSYHDGSLARLKSVRGRMHRWMQAHCLRRADLIHCVSHHTAREMQEIFPWIDSGRVRVVPLGIDQSLDDESPVPEVARHPAFVVFVGRRGGYKNGRLAIETIARLPDLTAVFVGGGTWSTDEMALIRSLQVDRRVLQLSNVTDAGLRWLYRRAVALWYPSSNEGFGFPAIEAAAAGCPVVAATGHAVEEVVRDYAEFISAPTVESMVSATAHALTADRTDLRRRGQEVAQRYTWRRYAEAMAKVYAELGVPMAGR